MQLCIEFQSSTSFIFASVMKFVVFDKADFDGRFVQVCLEY